MCDMRIDVNLRELDQSGADFLSLEGPVGQGEEQDDPGNLPVARLPTGSDFCLIRFLGPKMLTMRITTSR